MSGVRTPVVERGLAAAGRSALPVCTCKNDAPVDVNTRQHHALSRLRILEFTGQLIASLIFLWPYLVQYTVMNER
jgi:hypothetical protein